MSGKFGKFLFSYKRELQSQQKNVNVKAEHMAAVDPIKQTNKQKCSQALSKVITAGG